MKGYIDAFIYILGALIFFAIAFVIFLAISRNINIIYKTKESGTRIKIEEVTISSLKPILFDLLVELDNAKTPEDIAYTKDTPFKYSFSVPTEMIIEKENIIEYLHDFGFVVKYVYLDDLNHIKKCETTEDDEKRTDICVIGTKDKKCQIEIQKGKVYLLKIWEDIENKYLYLCMTEVGEVE